jgi:Sulfotransferase domain
MTPARVLPNFVIVGAPRCGTTALARYLGAHPQVFMAQVKEVRFFGREGGTDLDAYARHFEPGRDYPRVGEATPTYLYDEVAVQQMAAALPGALLIAVLREPVDRAYSQYWLNRSSGDEDRSFEEAVGLVPPAAGRPGEPARPLRRYLERSRYLPYLENLAASFPRASIHVEIFEELMAHPAHRFAAICRFLGIDDTVVPDNVGTRVNPHTRHRSAGLRRRAKTLPRPLRDAVGRLNTRPAVYPPMADATRSELAGRFRDANQELATWLGRDGSPWPA